MYGLAAAASLAFASITNGLPSVARSSEWDAQGIHYLATFDDVSAGLLANLPVRGVTALGPYDGLDYIGANVINVGGAVAGVAPQSEPNVLAFDVVTNAIEGGIATINADYDGTVTKDFDFSAFYFGCVVSNAETDGSVPVDCTLKVTAYKDNDVVGSQDFDFGNGLAVTEPMYKAELSKDFKGITKATFELTSLVDQAAVAVLLDNFDYTTYVKKD